MIQKKYLLLFLSLVGIYCALAFSIPPNPEALDKYNITAGQARLLSITIAVPVVAIWYIAFYGFSKFKEYAEHIKKDADGKGFNTLANGLMVAAIMLPVGSIISSTLSYVARNNLNLVPKIVTFQNYFAIMIAVVTFWLIYRGSKDLSALIVKKMPSKYSSLLNITYIGLGVLYIVLVMALATKRTPVTSTSWATYYVPDWAIITTQLIPYLFVWYIGLQSTRLLYFYRTNVQGIIYKQSLKFLANGIAAVVVTSIFVQVLSLFGTKLADASLGLILQIIYVLVAIIAVGYILIALGAKRLKKIEEIV